MKLEVEIKDLIEINNLEHIGSYLKFARKTKGYKQNKMAEELQISQAYLSQVENDLKLPSTTILDAMMKYLDITILLKIN